MREKPFPRSYFVCRYPFAERQGLSNSQVSSSSCILCNRRTSLLAPCHALITVWTRSSVPACVLTTRFPRQVTSPASLPRSIHPEIHASTIFASPSGIASRQARPWPGFLTEGALPHALATEIAVTVTRLRCVRTIPPISVALATPDLRQMGRFCARPLRSQQNQTQQRNENIINQENQQTGYFVSCRR